MIRRMNMINLPKNQPFNSTEQSTYNLIVADQVSKICTTYATWVIVAI